MQIRSGLQSLIKDRDAQIGPFGAGQIPPRQTAARTHNGGDARGRAVQANHAAYDWCITPKVPGAEPVLDHERPC